MRQTVSRIMMVIVGLSLCAPAPSAAGALAESLIDQVERASPETKAPDVLLSAGIRSGRYPKEEIYEAFRAELGQQRMERLERSWTRYGSALTEFPTVGQVAAVSVAGERYAGPVIVAAAAVAFLIALSGCASTPQYERPSFSWGNCDLIAPRVSNHDCNGVAGGRGYRSFQRTTWGCWGCY
jgi:hypothetical protein